MSNRQARAASPTQDDEERGFDHAITALLLIFCGSYCCLLGGTMTGLAYAYENRTGFTSVAESWGLRTDIAGPVLLGIGGACVIVALILITAFGVCGPRDWSTRKITPMDSPSPSSIQMVSTISGRQPY